MPTFEQLSKKDFKDYDFIAGEFAKFLQFGPGDLKKHYEKHPADQLHNIPRPGGGIFLFSHAGDERFWQIAERGLSARGSERRKHDINRLVQSLKREFIQRLLGSPDSIREDNAHDLFDFIFRALCAENEQLEHFVPCSVVAHRIPAGFSIGPVSFVLKEDFFRQHNSTLKAKDELFFSRFKDFFLQFRWVASVKVPACNRAISTLRARIAVQNALDLFKLFAGFERASRVRQGYSFGGPEHMAELVRNSEEFSILHGSRLQDAVVADDWYSHFSQHEAWKITEKIIETSLNNWDELPELQQRFLDALTWHGEAISEPIARSRLVKFWAAIERVVSTRSSDNVTKKAALLHARIPEEFDAKFTICQRLYSIRSSIVHGGKAHSFETIETDAIKTEQVSRDVIIALSYILQHLSNQGQLTRAGLENEFKQLEIKLKR
jgi:hypothetical protein